MNGGDEGERPTKRTRHLNKNGDFPKCITKCITESCNNPKLHHRRICSERYKRNRSKKALKSSNTVTEHHHSSTQQINISPQQHLQNLNFQNYTTQVQLQNHQLHQPLQNHQFQNSQIHRIKASPFW